MRQLVLFSSEICSAQSVRSFVQLTSNPQDLTNIRPGDSIVFTCITSGSSLQWWKSVHYVANNGELLAFGTDEMAGTKKRTPNNVSEANLIVVTSNGLVLESQLNITVSADYPTSNVTCINNSLNVTATICFSVAMGELSPRY